MRTTYVRVETLTPAPTTPSTKPRNLSRSSTAQLNTPSPAPRRPFGLAQGAAAPPGLSAARPNTSESTLKPEERRTVTRMGIGRKKRACVACIVLCYALFFLLYFCLVLYIVG